MPIRFSAFGRVFAPSWPMTLATLVLLAVFISLGRWQWERGEAKQAVWSEFERKPAAKDLGTRDPDAVERFAHVRLSGRFDGAHQFLLDNRSHAGKPGYEVLTPFVRDAGERILVNRGWMPFTGYRERLPDVSLPDSGAMTISGYLDELPASGLASGRAAPDAGNSWPKLTSFPSHAELERALGEKISRRMLLLDAAAPAGYVREWKPPGLAPTRHLSYAIQWWGFAVVLLVIYFGLNFRKVS
jgi:surfeit locus 1 family protein